MSAPPRVSNEQVVEAYKATGSVWKAGKLLGIVGQSVWERLVTMGIKLPGRRWDAEELAELRSLAGTMPIGEIARRLARPYHGVALKLSRLGIKSAPKRAKKLPRGAGFDKASTTRLMSDVEAYEGVITKFCRSRGLHVDTVVLALQKHTPERWEAYTRGRYPVPEKACTYCERKFIPTTNKQQTCSRQCSTTSRADASYFGGKRRATVGLAEGICQLCRSSTARLASHHVLGKENDPENDFLIALCNGCHAIVGTLAGRKFIETPEMWEDLISLVMMRRLADKAPGGSVGAHAEVHIEWLQLDDLEHTFPDEQFDMVEMQAARDRMRIAKEAA